MLLQVTTTVDARNRSESRQTKPWLAAKVRSSHAHISSAIAKSTASGLPAPDLDGMRSTESSTSPTTTKRLGELTHAEPTSIDGMPCQYNVRDAGAFSSPMSFSAPTCNRTRLARYPRTARLLKDLRRTRRSASAVERRHKPIRRMTISGGKYTPSSSLTTTSSPFLRPVSISSSLSFCPRGRLFAPYSPHTIHERPFRVLQRPLRLSRALVPFLVGLFSCL